MPSRGSHLSDEAKLKLSVINKGKRLSEETKRKISESERGEKHYNYGKHLSDDTKAKLSAANQGRRLSDETRSKISVGLVGRPCSDETKSKIAATKVGDKNPNYGKKLSEETRHKMSVSRMGCKNPQYGKPHTYETKLKLSVANSGENNAHWKGGISFEPYCPKFNDDLKIRIRSFFEYRCVMCGKSTIENGKELCCHHVTYDKSMCCDGKPVIFAALCYRHHNITNHHQIRWENMLRRVIDEVWNGRSYYTKDEYFKLSTKNGIGFPQ